MAECEMMSICLFFKENLLHMPKVAEVFRRDYCRGQVSECARFIVAKALGSREIPSRMFPNEKENAVRIVMEKIPEFKMEEIRTVAEK